MHGFVVTADTAETTTTTLAESKRRKQKDSQKKRKSPRIALFFGKRKGTGVQEGDLHTPAPSVQLEMEPGRYQKRKRRRWRRGRRLEVKGMERRGWRRRKRRNVKPSLFFFFLLLQETYCPAECRIYTLGWGHSVKVPPKT